MLTWELIEAANRLNKLKICTLPISNHLSLNFTRPSIESDEQYYPPSRIAGELSRFTYPDSGPVKIFTSQVFNLQNVTGIGWRTVANESLFLTDEASGYEAIKRITNENTSGYFEGFILNNYENNYSISYVKNDIHLPGKSFFLSYLEPTNYGSFLLRGLPKLLDYVAGNYQVDRLVFGSNQKWIAEFLRILGVDIEIVFLEQLKGGVTFEELYFPMSQYNEGFISNSMKNKLSTFIEKVPSNNIKRVFISRIKRNIEAPTYRPLTNELEIATHLEQKHGFTIVNLEDYSVADQISIFKGADFIIGPSGSGLLNSIFSRPTTKLIELESFTYCIRQHARVYSSSQLNYGVIFGDFDASDDRDLVVRKWGINLKYLDEMIQGFLHGDS